MKNVTLKIVKNEQEWNDAIILVKEYADSLDFNLSFQHFDEELDNFQKMYGLPFGVMILLYVDNLAVGCIGIRKMENDIAEFKRMFIKNEYRGFGYGKMLLEEAIKICIQLNYKYVRLDTIDNMHSAISIYKQYSFYEIAPYCYNPFENAKYFEKKLKINNLF